LLPKPLKYRLKMKYSPLEHQIDKLLRPAISGLGFALVLVEFKSGVLQVLVEKQNGASVSLDDCSAINKVISPLMEVEDPIPGAYTLEISSPGIDRPLITGEDFERYKGFEAKVELEHPMENGQKRFRGVILGSTQGVIGIKVDQEQHTLPLNAIKKARLVLSDELIKATRDRQKQLSDAV
jgi:ribosome maturation factor RimP